MSKKNVSIKEIAELSGVSVATVSRVINNNGRFSEETKQKVLAVIAETNYETNTVAKSLRMKKSNTIGILVPDISNAFFSSLVGKLERHLFEQGYSTIICNTNRNREKEVSYLNVLESKMIDGLIVISGQKEFTWGNRNRKIPIVCIDRKPQSGEDVVLIHSDNYQGGIVATEALVQSGCKRIALLANRLTMSSFKFREEGFSDTLKKHQLPNEASNYIEVPPLGELSHTEAAKLELLKRFQAGQKYDGIFALNDRLAIGAIEAALAFGLKIPEDIRIVGFDNDPISKYCYPKLTTVKQNTTELAQRAGIALLSLIEEDTVDEKLHVVPIELIKRGTTL